MNRGRNGGSSSFNPRSSSSSSNSESPHHPKLDNTSISANAKGRASCTGMPPPRPVVDSLDVHSWPDLASSSKMDTSRTKRASPATTSSESAIGHHGCAPVAGSPAQPYNPESSKNVLPQSRSTSPKMESAYICDLQARSTVEPLEIEEDGVMGHESPDRSKTILPQPTKTSATWEYVPSCATQEIVPSKIEEDGVTGQDSPDGSKNIMPQPRKTSAKWERVPSCVTQSVRKVDPLKTGWSGVMGQDSSERSNNSKSHPAKTSQMREYSHGSSDRNDDKPFDICLRHGTHLLKTSLFEKNREKRKDLERSSNDYRGSVLRPGMVLLKNFIPHANQLEIIKKCRDFGIGDGGFYQPGYNDGAKLRLHMMCLGKDWDPQRRSYEEFRSFDGAKPPIIPAEFKKLVSDALQSSYAIMRKNNISNPEKAIPWMEPDICIVNFYTESGKLGLHQDCDESRESIKHGLPVVSFSIGCSAEFLYGDDRDVDKAAKVELKSGDVLIFGGKSRDVFHGVPSINQNSAPKFLADEANLRPGRLNLTFRKF